MNGYILFGLLCLSIAIGFFAAIWLKIFNYNTKPKPGKWYPIKWTEFKYRPGGNKNSIELLRPDHVIIQVPLLKKEKKSEKKSLWTINAPSIPYHGVYSAWTRQKALYRCWKENNFVIPGLKYTSMPFMEFVYRANIERVK